MGINGTFQMGGEQTTIVIDGSNLMFTDESGTITTIEGLKLDYLGVLREFPELEGDKEWRKKTIELFKERYKLLKNEKDRLDYVREELTKFGWTPLFWQRWGWRPQRFT